MNDLKFDGKKGNEVYKRGEEKNLYFFCVFFLGGGWQLLWDRLRSTKSARVSVFRVEKGKDEVLRERLG